MSILTNQLIATRAPILWHAYKKGCAKDTKAFAEIEPVIGMRIPTYSYDEGQVSAFSTTEYYPIFSGNEIVALYTTHVVGAENETHTIDAFFTNELNGFYQRNPEFLFVWAGSNLFAKNKNASVLLCDYSKGWDIEHSDVTSEQIAALVIPDVKHFAFSHASCQAVSAVGVIEENTLDIEAVKQLKTNGCWCACMTSCINYIKNESFTYDDVRTKTGLDDVNGATQSAVSTAFKNNYKIPNTSILSTPTYAKIKTSIDNDLPMCIHFKGTSSYHMMVAHGYHKKHTSPVEGAYDFMEPKLGNFVVSENTVDGAKIEITVEKTKFASRGYIKFA